MNDKYTSADEAKVVFYTQRARQEKVIAERTRKKGGLHAAILAEEAAAHGRKFLEIAANAGKRNRISK